MGDTTAKLMELRPVVFRYKQHVEASGDAAPTEYGLIAEEVAEIFPELVVHDEDGEPFTVKYHLLSSMLLNELQRLSERVEAQDEAHAGKFEVRLAMVEKDAEIDELRERVERLEALAGEALAR